MSEIVERCDHSCAVHKPVERRTQILGAVDTSERGRRRARQAMSPEARKRWDELNESVAEFKRSRTPK